MDYNYYNKEYSNNIESEISLIKGTKTDKLSVLDDSTVKFLSKLLFYQYKKSNELYINSYDILKIEKLKQKAIIAKKLSNVCKDISVCGNTETTNNRLLNLLEVAKNNEVLIY